MVECWDYADEDRCCKFVSIFDVFQVLSNFCCFLFSVDTDQNGVSYVFNPIANMWSLNCVNSEELKTDTLANNLCVKIGKARASSYRSLEIVQSLSNSTSSVVSTEAMIVPMVWRNNTTPIVHRNYCPYKTAIELTCTESMKDNKLAAVEIPVIPQPLIVHAEGNNSTNCSAFPLLSKWVITSGQCAL